MGRVVPITTPLTQEVGAFVGILQSKGSAVVRVDEPQVFRQAVRVEARRRGGFEFGPAPPARTGTRSVRSIQSGSCLTRNTSERAGGR